MIPKKHRKMKKIGIFLSLFASIQAQAQSSVCHFAHTDSTHATADKIWKVWTDVPNWKQWDKGLREASLEGPFVLGAKGRLTPDKGPASSFVISELIPGKGYTFKTRIPLGWIIVRRTLEVREEKTFFRHEVRFTGPFKVLLGRSAGRRYRAMLPETLSAIKHIAERP